VNLRLSLADDSRRQSLSSLAPPHKLTQRETRGAQTCEAEQSSTDLKEHSAQHQTVLASPKIGALPVGAYRPICTQPANTGFLRIATMGVEQLSSLRL
jgi:hypothetical protein